MCACVFVWHRHIQFMNTHTERPTSRRRVLSRTQPAATANASTAATCTGRCFSLPAFHKTRGRCHGTTDGVTPHLIPRLHSLSFSLDIKNTRTHEQRTNAPLQVVVGHMLPLVPLLEARKSRHGPTPHDVGLQVVGVKGTGSVVLVTGVEHLFLCQVDGGGRYAYAHDMRRREKGLEKKRDQHGR